MRYTFTLKDLITKESYLYSDPCDYLEEEEMLYLWLEGNYSCDCNRMLFVYNVIGFPCNKKENRIILTAIRRADGQQILLDSP